MKSADVNHLEAGGSTGKTTLWPTEGERGVVAEWAQGMTVFRNCMAEVIGCTWQMY